jgi:hypothetical protein
MEADLSDIPDLCSGNQKYQTVTTIRIVQAGNIAVKCLKKLLTTEPITMRHKKPATIGDNLIHQNNVPQ